MKKIFVGLLAIIVLSCKGPQKQEGFLIHGSVTGLKGKQALLQRFNNGTSTSIDSSAIDSTSGKFELKGQLEAPEVLYISFPADKKMKWLFIENSEITLTGKADSLDKAKVTGSKTQDEYVSYADKMSVFYKRGRELDERYDSAKKAGKADELKALDNENEKLGKEVREFNLNFVKQNKGSYIAPYILLNELSYSMKVDQLDTLVAGFDTTIRNSPYLKILKDMIEVLKKVAINKPAPDFTMNDSLGNPIKLSSLYGKYLLIDFWASWCGSCRRENPNVVAAYKEFSKKGFDVLGVSFDRDKHAWTKAIKDDKLSWHHVSDLQYWSNAAGKLYGIQIIPSNVLLNPKGIIIAKNLRGEDLKNKLKELLR